MTVDIGAVVNGMFYLVRNISSEFVRKLCLFIFEAKFSSPSGAYAGQKTETLVNIVCSSQPSPKRKARKKAPVC